MEVEEEEENIVDFKSLFDSSKPSTVSLQEVQTIAKQIELGEYGKTEVEVSNPSTFVFSDLEVPNK